MTMNTQQVQVKLTLPFPMAEFVMAKAQKFGLSLSAYIKNLVINDVKDEEYPIFKAAKVVDEAYQQSLVDEKNGQTVHVKPDDLDKFFDNL